MQQSKYNVFKNPKDYTGSDMQEYSITSADFINTKKGVIRIWSSSVGKYCDIHIRQDRGFLDNVVAYPSLYHVRVSGIEKAKVDAELKEPTEKVGDYAVGVVYGDVVYRNELTQARKNASYVSTADTGPRKVLYRISDPTPEMDDGKPAVKGGITFFETTNDKAGIMVGNGRGDEVIIGDGVRVYGENGPISFNRDNADYGANTNSHNFLQHYLIPIAAAAGLPLPPRLINIPKYIAIGLMTKNIAQAIKTAVTTIRKEF